MKQYNWGIIGAGIIAHKFADALSRNERCNLRAVASKTPEKASNFAKEYSLEHAYTYDQIVNDSEIDVIYIATTHNFHYENAKLALEHGKNVVIEKPITINAKQAIELRELANKQNSFLMEASWVRFLPSYIKLKELLKSGEIGDIKQFHISFGNIVPKQFWQRLSLPELAGGVTLDIGYYPITFVCYLLGEIPSEVHSSATFNEHGVDETTNYLFKFPSNAQANICSSFNLKMIKQATIYGTKGYVHYPLFQEGRTFTIHKHIEGDEYESEDHTFNNDDNGFIYQVEEVVKCLDEKKLESDTIPVSESIQIMELMDSMRKDWGFKYPGE